jgi:hypothetical protein
LKSFEKSKRRKDSNASIVVNEKAFKNSIIETENKMQSLRKAKWHHLEKVTDS